MKKLNLRILIPVLIIWLNLIWFPNKAGMWLSPIILLGAIGYLIHVLISKQEPNKLKNQKLHPTVYWSVFVLLAVILLLWCGYLFDKHPIDIAKSDIIPLIKEIYYTRLVRGEFVYATVYGYDYKVWTPNYLPMHWMPFCIAFYNNFDPRYTAVISFLIAQLAYAYYLKKHAFSIGETLFKLALPFILAYSVLHKQPDTFVHNIEFLIVGYYVVLAVGLINNNRFLQWLGISSALLSRYFVAFYLPIDAWLNNIFKEKKQYAVYVSVGVTMLLLYVIPFVWHDPTLFFKGAQAYDVAALGEWDGQSWQAKGDKPFQLFRGYGFASWFYSIGEANLLDKINLLKKTLLLSMPICWLVCYLYFKKSNQTHMNKVLSLFVVISVFNSFVLVPYNYLYWHILFLIPVVIMQTKIFHSNTKA